MPVPHPGGTYPLCDVSKVVSLGPRTFFVFSPQIPRQQTHISDQKRDVGHPACSRFSLSGMSPIGTFHQPTPSPPAFDSKIFFLKGFDSNLDTNQIRFWFWRFEWVENTARTPGLSLFLIHYFQYTKRTITHLLSISFWEVVWFQDWGRVLQR